MNTTPRKFPWQRNGMTYCTGSDGQRICTGSMLGRRECIPHDAESIVRVRLRKVRMSADGCYDQGGAYWGQGTPLYCAWGDSGTEQAEIWVRAKSRTEAKAHVLNSFPNAKFYS